MLKRCVGGHVITTYTVDGGYYDDSGLLSLLQLWSRVESLAQTCKGCPAGIVVEPWFIVLDNRYRSRAASPAVPR